ncbi:MAG: Clp protease ClpP [Pirellulaceae bacterium]|jgi:ATP-dependent Clp protease protease subunit|nr:Clp protease ClpP [Pirellulaceae bacterium]
MRIETRNGMPELYLYGEIAKPAWYMDPDEVISAENVLDALEAYATAPQLAVRINSPGGDVFEAVAIYQALGRFAGEVLVEIDALAASAATIVAMAGDQVTIAGNAMLMIHRAWTYAAGNAKDLAAVAETLAKVDENILETYAARVGEKATREQLAAWLDAETWMSAGEAVERGFADRAGDLQSGVEARVVEGRFKNCPASLLQPATKPAPSPPAGARERPAGSPSLQVAARLAALRARYG